ncbi:MAG: hypothetical protein HC918_10885 [Oscillatoriales cyanobacterium SM2_1_8]|nr:hypothetical protein [Oscillatoriales cyanobacterium SM2_1_8]
MPGASTGALKNSPSAAPLAGLPYSRAERSLTNVLTNSPAATMGSLVGASSPVR